MLLWAVVGYYVLVADRKGFAGAIIGLAMVLLCALLTYRKPW